MGSETAIAWTDHTFNPWIGCQRVSPGCENCYAEARDVRFDGGAHWGPGAARRVTSAASWANPRKWNRDAVKAGRTARVFCASLADVFEDRRDLDEPRARLFDLIEATPFLDWQLLTKRPENMVRLAPSSWAGGWPSNVWAGTTVEDERRADERIPHLLLVPATVRFLSCEPLLGRVDLNGRDLRLGSAGPWLDRIHWVIVGGESGGGARPFALEWARLIVDRCKSASIPRPVFVKQLGRVPVLDEATWRSLPSTPLLNANNRTRAPAGTVPLKLVHDKGEDVAEWPKDLQIQEFPR